MFRVIEGRTVFFPLGRFGRGIVLDNERERKIDRVIAGRRSANMLLISAGLLLLPMPLLVVAVVGLRLAYWIRIVLITKGLERSDVRLPVRDIHREAAESTSMRMILFQLLAPAVAAVCLLCIGAVWLTTRPWFAISALGVAGFMAWDVFKVSGVFGAKLALLLEARRAAPSAAD